MLNISVPMLPFNRAEWHDRPCDAVKELAADKQKAFKQLKAGVKPKSFSWDDVEFEYRMPKHLRSK